MKLNNNVDDIISIPLRLWKKNKLKLIYNLFIWCKKYYHTKFDYVVDSQGLLKSALIAKIFSNNIYGYKYTREKIASYLYKHQIEVIHNTLMVNKNRYMYAKIFNYYIDQQKINFGLNLNFKNNPINSVLFLNNNDYIVIFANTSQVQKKYPLNMWITIIKYLTKHNKKIILPFGNYQEQLYVEQIKDTINNKNVIIPNQIFNISQIYQLIVDADFVLGVDTGLTHLANALNKKLIAIFTVTDPTRTGIVESDIAVNMGNIDSIPIPQDIIHKYLTIQNLRTSLESLIVSQNYNN